MPSHNLRRIATWAAIIGLAWYAWVIRSELAALQFKQAVMLFPLVLSVVLNLATSVLLTHALVRAQESRITLPESAALTIVGTLANTFSPARAGAAYRAFYMKRRYGLSIATFSTTVVAYVMLTALLASSTAIAAILSFPTQGLEVISIDQRALVVAVAGGIAAIVFLVRTSSARFPVLGVTVRNWWLFLRRPRTVALLTIVGLAHVFSGIVALWSGLRTLGLHPTLAETTVIASAGVLSTLVAITPGAIGFFEGTLIVTAGTVSTLPEPLILGAALLQRIALVTVLTVVTPISLRYLRVMDPVGPDQDGAPHGE